jgi:TctA family transporter
MRLNFRRLGCFCLLLVIFGFFSPIACDANGFQIANGDAASSGLKFALYGLFIAAIVGVIVGVVLMVNKNTNVPIIIDWLVILTCMGCALVPFFINVNKWGRSYQSGAYMILIGIILSFVFLLIASFTGDTDYSTNRNSHSSNKRCRLCNTVYSGPKSICPKCGSSLYEKMQNSK